MGKYVSSFTYKQFGDLKTGRNRAHGFSNWGLNTYSVNTIDFKDSIIVNENPHIISGVGYNQIDILNKILFNFKPNKHIVKFTI